MAETRELAAILVSDVAGYSRLAGTDEDRTLARPALEAHVQTLKEQLAAAEARADKTAARSCGRAGADDAGYRRGSK
jgi:class 3 adenylate cyclase